MTKLHTPGTAALGQCFLETVSRWRHGDVGTEDASRAKPNSLFAVRHSSFSACLRGAVPSCLFLLILMTATAAAADLPPLSAQSAPPDAVIELWEQTWTLNPDGSTEYEQLQHVRINHPRAHDEFADPRITYNVDTDELEVTRATTRLPDGTYRDMPDYGHVLVSPNASAGWPAFAAIRQHLLVMSGIVDGCVLEVGYRIKTQPGVDPYLAADVRLDHHYPIKKRVITVNLPAGKKLSTLSPKGAEALVDDGTHRWVFSDIPAYPNESQSPPWQTRDVRLAFTTAASTVEWVNERIETIEAAADGSPLVEKLAKEWVGDAKTDEDKLRNLQEKLAETFNFVEFPMEWRPFKPRPASEVLESNYGLPGEAAAALLALAKAAGLSASPVLIADKTTCVDRLALRSMVSAYGVALHPVEHDRAVESSRLPVYAPRVGCVVRDARWADHILVYITDGLSLVTLEPWTKAIQSQCTVSGKVAVDDQGTLSGRLTVALTGLFASAEDLRTTGDQERKINAVLSHVLPAAELDAYDVQALGGNTFRAVVDITSEPLDKIHDAFTLELAEHGLSSLEIDFPLDASRRQNPVWLAGAFSELVDLTIEWPEGWHVDAFPAGQPGAKGDWGELRQVVTRDKGKLRIQRSLRIESRQLPPAAMETLYPHLNDLRAAHSRMLLLRPE